MSSDDRQIRSPKRNWRPEIEEIGEPIRFRRVSVSSVPELVRLFEDYRFEQWIFRGHQSCNWSFETTFERQIPDGSVRGLVEWEILRQFKGAGHQYLDEVSLPLSDIEWLALLQHHGGPTRLLDWTRSAFVALYFAVEARTDEPSCCVWGVDRDWLLDCASQAIGATTPFGAAYEITTLQSPSASLIATFGSGAIGVLPIEFNRVSKRMHIQQGLSLCPLNIAESFVANWPKQEASQPVRAIRVDIPAGARGAILQFLRRINITSATLFPGLEGFARSFQHLPFYSQDWLEKEAIGKVLDASSIADALLAPELPAP